MKSEYLIQYSREYSFSKGISFSKFYKDLFQLFDLKIPEDSIPRELSQSYLPKTLEQIFERFDSVRGNTLILSEIENIVDKFTGDFIEPSFLYFFKFLLCRKSFTKNKVYLLSSINAFSSNFRWRKVIFKIKLYELNKEAILKIMLKQIEQHSYDSHEEDFAKFEISFEGNQLHKLVEGHPFLAEAAIANNIHHDSIYEDAFNEEKKEYILEHLNITDEEQAILNFLVFVSGNITENHIKELQPQPTRIIKALSNKMILIKTIDGFRIPSFIKSVIMYSMEENTKNIFRQRYVSYCENNLNNNNGK